MSNPFAFLLFSIVEIFLHFVYLIFGDNLHKLKSPHWLPKEQGNIVITGGTAGIGYETAKYLGKLGHRIIITGRDEKKGLAAVEQLKKETGNNRIQFFSVDFASFKEVRDFAQKIKDLNIPIHVLVNNAGATNQKRIVTNDGLELTFQANHASVQLLTTLLLDRIKEAKPAGRIVNLSSNAHWIGNINFDDLQMAKSYSSVQYANTKLANILFTRELKRRLEKEGRKDIVTVAVHPGTVATELARNFPEIVKTIIRLLFKTPALGARTQIYVSLAPAKDLVSGGYYHDCRLMPSSSASQNPEIAAKLWEVTEKLY